MSDLSAGSRSERLDGALSALLAQTPEIEAAAVVSFDGLPMAAALPAGMDEDRVAAMSAALLSLGERATQGLGRGDLSQVYIEGETGTVYLVSADDEAVLVAVASKGAKVGMMLFEVRRAAAAVADVLREEYPEAPVAVPAFEAVAAPEPAYTAPEPVFSAPVAPPPPAPQPVAAAPALHAVPTASAYAEPAPSAVPTQPVAAEPVPTHGIESAPAPASYVSPLDAAWSTSSYAPSGTILPPSAPGTTPHWS